MIEKTVFHFSSLTWSPSPCTHFWQTLVHHRECRYNLCKKGGKKDLWKHLSKNIEPMSPVHNALTIERARELLLPLTSCSAQESKPCTSFGCTILLWVNPVDGGMAEPIPKLWAWESCPRDSSVLQWCGQKRNVLLIPRPSSPMTGKEANPPLYLLQHLRNWPLHLS